MRFSDRLVWVKAHPVKTGVLMVLGMAALPAVFIVLLLPIAVIQYGVFPSCYGGGTTYSSGEHLGFRVGMSREEAAAQMMERHGRDVRAGDLWITSGTGERSGMYATSAFPTSPTAILAIQDPKQTWIVDRSWSLCVMSVKRTMLEFQDGRLVTIRDDLSYSGI